MATPPRVIVTDLFVDDLAPEREVLDGIAAVEALGAHGEAQLTGRVEDADALICNHGVTIGPATLDRLRHCKLVVRCGVGYDNIDFRHAATRGIPVANVPDYGTEEVADSALALTMTLARGVSMMNSRVRAGVGPWDFTPAVPLLRLRGEVFGCIGFGAIGMATAVRAKALGMHVICYDPFLRSGFDKAAGVERVDRLEALLARSYVVSLHCGLTPQTRHLIDRKAIDRMRRGALLVNTARGALVDTAALPDAIASGQLGGAGLDVLETDIPDDQHPLIRAWRDPNHPAHHRVVINPHIAFYSEQSRREMRQKAARACRAALRGEPVPNLVNGVRA